MGGLISGVTASLLTTALAFSYIEVMKKVVTNQYEGKVTRDEEISEMMYNELKKHFMVKYKLLKLVLQWLMIGI